MMMKRMQEAARAKQVDVKIWAVSEAMAKENIPKADIVLLGPQIRYLLNKMQEMAEGKPVMVMDMTSYGNLNGAKVLSDVLCRLRENKR